MTITCKILRPVALFILSALLFAPKLHAAGVVSICDEPHFLAAVAGGGSVTFSCSGTISLTSTVPILDNTRIDGTGQAVTFTDGGASNLFFVSLGCPGGTACTLDMRYVTLTNAKTSAINNSAGTLYVVRTTFSNNASDTGGGAIFNDAGTATVGESTFIHNAAPLGGAIYNNTGSDSVLEVVRSTFFLNSAEITGGGIYNNGVMTIYTSTFTSNSATVDGGNIFHGDGSGAYARIFDSTISQGQARQGQGANIASPFTSPSATPVGISNTIMANPVGSGNCDGTISDFGDNLQWPASLYPCVGVVADPKLGPLASNGGPTQTMALLPGSAAIDKTVTCGASDQRRILRPQGPRCDIGAYEVIPNITGVVGEIGTFMMNFLPNLPARGSGVLTQQMIAPLSRSLDPTLWQADGNHLDPRRGEQVFDLHQTVVNNLSELIVDQTQLDYINNLLFADRALAAAAMTAANCGVPGVVAPPNIKCAQATQQLALGDGSAAAGNYAEAIEHYKSAWSDVASPPSQD